MAIKTKQFVLFGNKYSTVEFSAMEALSLLSDQDGAIAPTEQLKKTSILVDGAWVSLHEESAIDLHVRDKIDTIVPRLVLNGLMDIVYDHSFAFLKTFKQTKIPGKYKNKGEVIEALNTPPLVTQLLGDGLCTLKELEEYYSLRDAMLLLETITVNAVNRCMAEEAAAKK